MADIELPPCPKCGHTLRLEMKLKAKLVSLSGVTMKLGARDWPYLVCIGLPPGILSCGFQEEGKIVTDFFGSDLEG